MHAEQAGVVVEGEPDRDPVGARVVRGDEVLAAVLDPLHRPTQLVGGGDHRQLLALGEELLAEPAADVVGLHPHLVLGDAERPGAGLTGLVRALGREPHVELAGRGRVRREHPTGLHRDVGVPVLDERLGDDVRRGREDGVEVGVGRRFDPHGDVRAELGVHERGVLGGALGVDDGGQRLVVDLDQLGRVLGEVARLGHDERDRVADEADVALGEGPEGRAGHGRRVTLEHGRLHRADVRVEVRGGEHRPDAGHGPRRVDVEAGDPGVREVAAHERGVQHPRHDHVVDVGALPGQQPWVLAPADGLPHEPTGRRRAHGALPSPGRVGAAPTSRAPSILARPDAPGCGHRTASARVAPIVAAPNVIHAALSAIAPWWSAARRASGAPARRSARRRPRATPSAAAPAADATPSSAGVTPRPGVVLDGTGGTAEPRTAPA